MAPKKRLNTKDLVGKIAKITQERMKSAEVVSLSDFRRLKEKKEPIRLLLIEDDESIRKAMKRIFEDEGLQVLAAADGTQLDMVFDESPIDLILLDIGLPWINGFELAELMKSHRDLKEIPIVFVSGRDSEVDIKRAFEAGADDFVSKPFTVDHLKKTVFTLLELST